MYRRQVLLRVSSMLFIWEQGAEEAHSQVGTGEGYQAQGHKCPTDTWSNSLNEVMQRPPEDSQNRFLLQPLLSKLLSEVLNSLFVIFLHGNLCCLWEHTVSYHTWIFLSKEVEEKLLRKGFRPAADESKGEAWEGDGFRVLAAQTCMNQDLILSEVFAFAVPPEATPELQAPCGCALDGNGRELRARKLENIGRPRRKALKILKESQRNVALGEISGKVETTRAMEDKARESRETWRKAEKVRKQERTGSRHREWKKYRESEIKFQKCTDFQRRRHKKKVKDKIKNHCYSSDKEIGKGRQWQFQIRCSFLHVLSCCWCPQ